MIFNIGCDSGYGYTMSNSALRESRFSSYIEKITEHKAESIKQGIIKVDEDNILIKFEDNYYVMGKLCEKHFMDSSRRVELNRVGDTFHLAQLLTSISLNAKDMSNVNVNLMVGLPVRSKDDRTSFVDWLSNKKFKITFLTRDKEYNKVISINVCHCLLQPLFPIFSAIGLEKAEGKNILSLDIGYGSTDGVRLEDNIPSESTQDQIDLIGAKRVLDELEEEIVAKYGKDYKHVRSISERTLQTVLETGVYLVNGKQLDVADVLETAFENYADYIFKEIQRRYIQKLPDIDTVLVAGGLACSETFMRKLAMLFWDYKIDVVTSLEPQWDICRGMRIMLDITQPDDFNREIDVEEETVSSDNQDIPKEFRGFEDVVDDVR